MSPKLLLWHHRCSWFCPSRTSALMDKGFGRLCGGEKGGCRGRVSAAAVCCAASRSQVAVTPRRIWSLGWWKEGSEVLSRASGWTQVTACGRPATSEWGGMLPCRGEPYHSCPPPKGSLITLHKISSAWGIVICNIDEGAHCSLYEDYMSSGFVPHLALCQALCSECWTKQRRDA